MGPRRADRGPPRECTELLPIARLDLLGPILLADGRVDEVRRLADDPTNKGEPPRDWYWIADTVLRAEIAVGLHDQSLAKRQYDLLLPHRGGLAVAGTGFVALGIVDTFLGDLALVLGERTAATRHYGDAAAIGQAAGAGHRAEQAKAAAAAAAAAAPPG